MILIDIYKELHGAIGDMSLDIKLEVKRGDFIAIAGESGSGKTTLLRILAGLEEAQGRIYIGDEVWLDKGRRLPVQKRKIGFVFQDYALFENMSVLQNLLYVNKDIKLAKELLELTKLTELQNRLPNTLSGGQKQRVALCRAMMNHPKLLLMDEPLSALDPLMRNRLQDEILALHRAFGTTTIMVSHDIAEIYKLANRVIVLNFGKIKADGSPKEILLKSSNHKELSFEGELLDIIKVDILYVAIVLINQQIIKIPISSIEANNFKKGQHINININNFTLNL